MNRGFKEVIGSLYDNKKVVYCRRYGIGLEFGPENEWGFGVYDIYPLPLKKVDIIGEYCLDKESDFFSLDEFEIYNKVTKDKTLSVGMHFKIL